MLKGDLGREEKYIKIIKPYLTSTWTEGEGYLPLKNTTRGSKMAVKLSLGSPKKPPQMLSSGFQVGVEVKLRLGKSSLMFQLPS